MLLSAAAGVAIVQALAVSAAWILRAREPFLRRYLPLFVSLAVGVLLATAILHLLPEAIAQIGNRRGVWLLFGGTVLFLFAIERTVSVLTVTSLQPELSGISSHVHHRLHTRPISLILASMLHSFVDGTAVATAFAAGTRIGWLTTLAIALHEIPHRTGDFALLIYLGVPAPRALRLVFLAGAPAFLGVLVVVLVGLQSADRVIWLLPVSAGSFLYIATVNLMPEIQGDSNLREVTLQLLSLALGVALVIAAAGVFAT
jgi:zinc and cadmium transporter